jgi:serine protease Do
MAQTQSKRVMAASASLIALAGAALGATVMATAEAQENLTPSLAQGVAPGAAPSFADLIEHVGPAVVSIEVVTRVQGPDLAQQITPEDLPPALREYFEFFSQGQGAPEEPQEARGAGSGFFISSDGLLVTNNHVVQDATEIMVTLNDGRELSAEVVGTDEPTDLALLRVEGGDFPFVQFDADPHYRVGDWVVAVGNPFGFGGSATAGIISAIGREDEFGSSARYNSFIQIDAPINRGNSGGPTFDLNGNVIGVNSQIFSPTGGNVGIGFAIPSDVAANIINQLAENGKVTRGWLGVGIDEIDENMAEALGVDQDSGAIVGSVEPGSPAEQAGFQVWDIIVSVDGQDVAGPTELTRTVGSLQAGQTYAFEVLREGREQTIDVTLGERPPEDELLSDGGEGPAAPMPVPSEPVQSDLGLSLAPVTPSTRSELGLDESVQGVVVMDVENNSPAGDEGFSPGLVIGQVDGRAVTTPEEFNAAVEAARSAGKTAVALLIHTPNGSTFAALPLDEETEAETDAR